MAGDDKDAALCHRAASQLKGKEKKREDDAESTARTELESLGRGEERGRLL